MKNFTHIGLAILLLAFTQHLAGQSTSGNNNPGTGKFIGYNAAGQNLEFRTNNTTYMQLMQNGINTVDGYTYNHDGFLLLSSDPTAFNHKPFSLLHLYGEGNTWGPQPWGYRDWMKAGITFTHNRDFMYVGPKANNESLTDAVIAWGDNKSPESGPDVLRFIFSAGVANGTTTISSDVFDASDYDGVELGRMIGNGHVGFGSYWNNTFQPHRTLDVIKQRNDPQFRITRIRSTNVNTGTNADFQVSNHGNLHIVPRTNGSLRALAVGFFDDPSNATDPMVGTALDVGKGYTRIRNLPDEPPKTLVIGYQVDEVNSGEADNFLGRLDFPNSETMFLNGQGEWSEIENGTSDCDWEVIENVPGIDDVVTGVGNDCYPGGHVGIGVATPQAKLDVFHGDNQGNPKEFGARVIWTESPSDNVFGVVTGTYSAVKRYPNFPEARGVRGEVYNARINYAGDFRAYAAESGTTLQNFGVQGWAISQPNSFVEHSIGGAFFALAGNSNISPNQQVFAVLGRAGGGTHAYGVHGSAGGASVENWAGFFVGATHCTAGVWTSSDETLKQNIEPIEGALEVIQQIEPKSYSFLTEEYSQLNLPEGEQQGVIAQELAEVLPQLVKQTTAPAMFDTLGNEISAAIEFQSVNYTGLIPYLISAVKEQQSIIESQNEAMAQIMEQLNELQQQINHCCNTDRTAPSFHPNEETPGVIEKAVNELHQNTPNPFRSQTTISYTLEQQGKVVLKVFDKTGKPITTIVEAEQAVGTYRYEWNASGLPAGLYHYALYVNGELLVKKAIKLAD